VTCLNCDAALQGPYCAQCGQRAIPAYPTLREYAGDAWEELSGFDGRFARTLRGLLGHPGRLTVETLEGRRAQYLKPLRLYLSASVLYFLIAAAAPNVTANTRADIPGDANITIDLADPRGVEALTADERAQALANIADAPSLVRPFLQAVFEDPTGFRTRMLSAIPKMFFVMVPLFASITGLFYRRRPYMQHLTFALHLHAVVFLVMSVTEVSQFTRSVPVVVPVQLAAAAFLAWYAVRAQRVVYGHRWLATLLKSAGIGVVYALSWVPVMAAVLTWVALFR
jgi:hypothetical protein